MSFRVLDPEARPLTGYTTAHDKDLHLIAVRRDLSGFQHVHPTLDAKGTWATTLDLTPGVWRVFADFDPAGDTGAMTLGTDLFVTGSLAPQPLPEPAATTTVDGRGSQPIITDGRDDPARHAETADSLSLALLVLLESLSPEQRAVLLLHDVFDYSHAEIATIVGKSEDNVRQLATRARRHVDDRRPRFQTTHEQQEELAARFFAAAFICDSNSFTMRAISSFGSDFTS